VGHLIFEKGGTLRFFPGPGVWLRPATPLPSLFPSYIALTPTPTPTPPHSTPLLPSIPQVLRFKSYFVEAVPNSRLERERARIMTLSFHVCDNTLRVYEPPQESSGLYQVSVVEC